MSFAKGLFAVTIFVGSAGVVQKYAGNSGLLVYALAVAAATAVLPAVVEGGGALLTERAAVVLAVVTFVGLAVALIVVYPHANVHVPGQGTDRDDAADLGAQALMHGRAPYHQATYLGLPISQLPGALLLAVPFVAATGHSAYAALLWLPMLFLVAARLAGIRTALLVTWALMILSPGFWREFLTGGDLVSNTAYVLTAAALVYAARDSKMMLLVAAGAWLGLTLSSRPNLAFLLIPLGVALWRKVGWRRTSAALVAAIVTGVVVTVPLIVLGGGHSPLAVADKLSALNRLFPHAREVVLAAAIACAVVAGLRTRRWSLATLFVQGAVVQLAFTVALVAVDSVKSGTADFAGLISGYGVFALLLLAPAAALLFPHLHPRRVSV
jgi:hypothetical protein